MTPKRKRRPAPERVEITLVWKDSSKTRAFVPLGAAEVTCGKARFVIDPENATRYIEA